MAKWGQSALQKILDRIELGTEHHPEVHAAVLPNLDLVRADPCWIWTGARHRKGYGLVRDGGKIKKAHRITYEALVGPITDETIDHLCRVRPCCNPNHLEQKSNRDNSLAGYSPHAINAAKTTCPLGHPLTSVTVSGRVRRSCLTCRATQMRAYIEGHRDELRIYFREHHRRNAEKRNAQARARYAKRKQLVARIA